MTLTLQIDWEIIRFFGTIVSVIAPKKYLTTLFCVKWLNKIILDCFCSSAGKVHIIDKNH